MRFWFGPIFGPLIIIATGFIWRCGHKMVQIALNAFGFRGVRLGNRCLEHRLCFGRVNHRRTAFNGRVKYVTTWRDSTIDRYPQIRRRCFNKKPGRIRADQPVQHNQEAIQALLQGIKIWRLKLVNKPNQKHALVQPYQKNNCRRSLKSLAVCWSALS